MTFDFGNVIGVAGSALMVIAYAHSKVASQTEALT